MFAIFLIAISDKAGQAQNRSGDPDIIREITTTLAGSKMQGRGTGEPGGDQAAKYIAQQFARIGLKPGGDDSTYFQRLKVQVRIPLPETALVIQNHSFRLRRDFGIAQPPPPYELAKVTGDIVFVGYGVVSPELHRDDLAGINVAGKIVMLLEGKPENADPQVWDKVAAQRVVYGRLIERGARGFLVVWNGDISHFPSVAAFLSNRSVGFSEDLPYPVRPARWGLELLDPEYRLPTSLLVSVQTAEQIFRMSSSSFAESKRRAESGEFVSRDLRLTAAISPKVRNEEQTSSNVIGVLEGSDPVLKSQAVVYTAHYDAYGVDEQGTVFPGATDNALGVGKLLAVAARFAREESRPRRSILFLASTGEEYGDLGTGHWLRHPTWPLENVAADINFDGSPMELWGRVGFVINFSFGQSDLGPIVRRVAAAQGLAVIPDPAPEEELFTRGDHWAFVQRGIPALYLMGGPLDPAVEERMAQWQANHYHMPTDSMQPGWNWEGPRQMAELGFEIGRQAADQNTMPQWRPGSKFNHPRGTDLAR